MERTHEIIDNIYAAALTPSEWPSVLKSLQELFNANAAGIYTLDTENARLTQFELQGIEPNYINSYINHYVINNPWNAVSEFQIPGIIRTDQSLDKYYNSPGFYRKTKYFNEWLDPQDFYYSLGTNLLSHDNINTKFYMYRPKLGHSFSKQDIAKFRHLSRHMTRSMEMTRRLAIKDSQISDALHSIDHLKFSVLFLNEHSNIIHTNQFANKLLDEADGVLVKDRLINFSHKDSRKKLYSVIREALDVHKGQSDNLPCTVRIRRPSGKRPFYLTAIPLPRQTGSFSVPSAAIVLFISDPEQNPIIPTNYLHRRYGLTLTEAKLTQNLSQGGTLREAAEDSGLTYETARWYLKIIFQKTGTRRQTELLHLLLSDRVFVSH